MCENKNVEVLYERVRGISPNGEGINYVEKNGLE